MAVLFLDRSFCVYCFILMPTKDFKKTFVWIRLTNVFFFYISWFVELIEKLVFFFLYVEEIFFPLNFCSNFGFFNFSNNKKKAKVCVGFYPTFLPGTERITRSVFKQSLTGLNSEFSFKIDFNCKVKEHSLTYCLLMTGGRIIGCIPFPRVLTLCEIQTVLFRIWT